MTAVAGRQSRRRHGAMTFLGRVGAATVLVALVACQSADRSGRADEETAVFFPLADTNDDAAISLAEWDAFSDRLFVKLDADGDGQLTGDELQDDFKNFDLDNDGVIDPSEAPLLIGPADANGDSMVDRQEYTKFDWADYAADLDRSGGVTRQELRRARQRAFYSWDRDLDGVLHRDEIEEFVVPMIRLPF